MKAINLILYIILIIYLCYLTIILATDYQHNETRNKSGFVIWVIDTVDLFIHEAGHFFFGIFGRFMHFLGGTLMQLIIPIATIIVFGRVNVSSIPFTFYWLGQNMVNISIYIGDAPYLKLRLISKGAIHDWRWILNRIGALEYAEDIASVVNFLGIFICFIGIGFGLYFVGNSVYKKYILKI